MSTTSATPETAIPQERLTLPSNPTAIILDLDGTLTDSAPAITGSIAEALRQCGYPVPDDATLMKFVGPPIREGFSRFAEVAEKDLDRVVDAYRAHYRPRMTEVPLYPGIAELVRHWYDAGIPLALATAKLQDMAGPILDAVGLGSYFTVVRGATLKDSHELPGVQVKANVVAAALADLADAGIDTSGAVMVGDRDHDILGAASHEVPGILVGWGCAQPGEGARAAAVVQDADELRHLLGT